MIDGLGKRRTSRHHVHRERIDDPAARAAGTPWTTRRAKARVAAASSSPGPITIASTRSSSVSSLAKRVACRPAAERLGQRNARFRSISARPLATEAAVATASLPAPARSAAVAASSAAPGVLGASPMTSIEPRSAPPLGGRMQSRSRPSSISIGGVSSDITISPRPARRGSGRSPACPPRAAAR